MPGYGDHNLRSMRSAGRNDAAVHAPHPEDAKRPLCRKATGSRRIGPFEQSWSTVTCRACMKALGRTLPEPKRMSAKAAAAKALRGLGMDWQHYDFTVHNHLMPMSETGGIRIVESTEVSLVGAKAEQAVLDNLQALIATLWTNEYGRHRWQAWGRQREDDTWRVELSTAEERLAMQSIGYRVLASFRDLPDADLYWGETR